MKKPVETQIIDNSLLKSVIEETDNVLDESLSIELEARLNRGKTQIVLDAKKEDSLMGSLINNLPGFIIKIRNDKRRTIDYISDSSDEITGYKPSEFTLKKMPFIRIIQNEHRDRIASEINMALEKSISYSVQYPIITRDNRIKWVTEIGKGIFDDKGDLLYINGFVTDVFK